MSGLYGHYLREMFPFISSAPAASPGSPVEPNIPDVDPAEAEAMFRSYHHRLGRLPTEEEFMASVRRYAQGNRLQDGRRIAVGDYPPDSLPQLPQVAPTPMPEAQGRGLEGKLRPEDFASMLRQLELNNLRGRAGLETDYPRVSPQYQMGPYSNPSFPAFEDFARPLFSPIQSLINRMQKRMPGKDEESPKFGGWGIR